MKKLKTVCLGGTFDIIHRGHEKLIEKAFEVAKEVFIGLTSDRMVNKKVKSYKERKNQLLNYLKSKNFKAKIVQINNIYGKTLEEDFDGIVVSPETEKIAKEINELRNAKGKKQMKIFKIKYVLAKNGKLISSKRIRNGEIDKEGISKIS